MVAKVQVKDVNGHALEVAYTGNVRTYCDIAWRLVRTTIQPSITCLVTGILWEILSLKLTTLHSLR